MNLKCNDFERNCNEILGFPGRGCFTAKNAERVWKKEAENPAEKRAQKWEVCSLLFRKKKAIPNPYFLVRISSGGVGVFHVKGGAKKFGMSFETHGNQTFWRDVPGCCRDIPGVPEQFEEQKRFVFNSCPLQKESKTTDQRDRNHCSHIHNRPFFFFFFVARISDSNTVTDILIVLFSLFLRK